jgi:rhodanese-related sulfurtransferase
VSERRERLLPRACGLAAAGAASCGGVLLAYVRPGFDRLRPGTDPARLDVHLVATAMLDVLHVAFGVAFLACAAALAGRAWRAAAGRRSGAAAGLLTVAAIVAVATGLVVPWRELLPWAEGLGRNRARAALVLDAEGPFSELVDVRASYEPERRRVPGGSLTPAGLVTLVALHALALPIALIALRRARSGPRSPARTDP